MGAGEHSHIAALKGQCAQNSGRSKDHDGNDRDSGQQAEDQCSLLPGAVLSCVMILKITEYRHRIAPCVKTPEVQATQKAYARDSSLIEIKESADCIAAM
jgi:hypothetical protein